MTRDDSSSWETLRQEVYARDEYRCQNCGSRGGPDGKVELHVHHLIPVSQGGLNNRSNLKTLCERCHNAVHGRGTGATDVGLGEAINWQANTEVGMDFDECEVCGSGEFGYEANDMVKCMNCDWVYLLEKPYLTDAVEETFKTCPGRGCDSTDLEYKPFYFFSGKTGLMKCQGGCERWWRVDRETGEYELHSNPVSSVESVRERRHEKGNLRDDLLKTWTELKSRRS
jgi:hypothetical protein